MAFVSDPNAQDPTQGQQGTTSNPLSQQAPITSAPPAGAGKAAVTPSSSTPTQPFTNLQTYLSANAPQIQQEGQQIAGNLTNQYGQVQNDINAGQNTFNGQVSGGYTPMDQSTLDAFNASPTAVAGNPDQSKSFTGMYGDTYTGPANFETSPVYGNLSGEVQNAVSNAQGLQTPSGISSYFSSTSPNYTAGMGTLDSALLQGNPDVVSNIQSAAQPFNTLPGYLGSVVTGADNNVVSARQQAEAAKAAAQAAMTGQVGNLNSNVNAETSAAQKAVQDYNTAVQAYQAAIGNDIPQANQIKSLADQYGVTWNGGAPPLIDPNSISSPNVITDMPTAANASSAADYATLAALEKLSGGSITSPISDATASLGGSFKAPGSVDQSPLTNALNAMRDWAVTKANNSSTSNSANANDFVTAGNDWYVNLLRDLGWHYMGSGSYPAVFSTTNNNPPPGGGQGGGVGGFGGV